MITLLLFIIALPTIFTVLYCGGIILLNILAWVLIAAFQPFRLLGWIISLGAFKRV